MKWPVMLLVMLLPLHREIVKKKLPYHYLFGGIAFQPLASVADTSENLVNYKELPSLETPLLHHGLAHNDYWNTYPLMKALHHGYTYIEADIHLIKGELYVYHKRPLLLDKTRTLKNLYLQPLHDIFLERVGAIFPENQQPLRLLIDIKTNAARTYEVLKKQLAEYQEMLTTYEKEEVFLNAVSIIITGNRPIELMNEEVFRMACLDGRLKDLGKHYSPTLMPIISDRYGKILGWTSRLNKTICEKSIQKLRLYIRQVHSEGKLVRLWNSPESELVWSRLLDEGVDIINTDELERLQHFLISRQTDNIPVAKN